VFIAGDRLAEDVRGQLARASRLFAACAVVDDGAAVTKPGADVSKQT
jgi:hypothetical protein